MSQGITITSTTNSDAEVREAAGLPLGKHGEQLSLEDAEHSEESKMQRERSENGNGKTPIPRGLSKRFDKVYAQMKSAQEEREQARREAEQLRQEVARLRNGNGAAPHVQAQPEVQEAPPEETRQEAQPAAEDHAVKSLRTEYPDWDETFSRAERENFRIADEAAKTLHALPEHVRGHVSYLLAKNDDLRNELNKLPPAQQAAEVEGMARNVETIRTPHTREFSQKVKALDKSARAEMMRAGQENPLGTRILTSTIRELNALPNGVEVARYLLLHPEVCEPFQTMSQERAHLELGRISARLENGNGARQIVSKAPAPITPLRGGGVRPSVDLTDSEISYQDYKREREKNLPERRRRGYGV